MITELEGLAQASKTLQFSGSSWEWLTWKNPLQDLSMRHIEFLIVLCSLSHVFSQVNYLFYCIQLLL